MFDIRNVGLQGADNGGGGRGAGQTRIRFGVIDIFALDFVGPLSPFLHRGRGSAEAMNRALGCGLHEHDTKPFFCFAFVATFYASVFLRLRCYICVRCMWCVVLVHHVIECGTGGPHGSTQWYYYVGGFLERFVRLPLQPRNLWGRINSKPPIRAWHSRRREQGALFGEP